MTSYQEVRISEYEREIELNKNYEDEKDYDNEETKKKNIELLSRIDVLNNKIDDLKDENRSLKLELNSQKELMVQVYYNIKQLHIENEELKKEEEMYKKMKDLKLESLNCLMKSNIEAAATIDGFIKKVEEKPKQTNEIQMENENEE